MITILYIFLGILITRYLGKMIWNREDRDILIIDPSHPYYIDKKMYPIGSGICGARNNDRHIWQYADYHFDVPHERKCSFCGYTETMYLTGNKWRNRHSN